MDSSKSPKINTLHRLFMTLLFLCCNGCQLSYYLKSGYQQALIIKNQEPIAPLLQASHLTFEEKNKLKLILEAKDFAETHLGLKKTSNYTSFVNIQRPYVTYIVQAAYKNKLEYYTWNFPFVGKVPYKGFFDKESAQSEADHLSNKNLDISIRGVRAYSTLGWFQDPVLSSMLTYDDDEIINLIIHELTHSTLFIKNSVDFNEQLATFVGNKGTELFYMHQKNLSMISILSQKNKDEIEFSKFISEQFQKLKDWYSKNPQPTEIQREKQFQNIQSEFLKIKFKKTNYNSFKAVKLNNASFLGYKTYVYDLSKFETLFIQEGSMKNFIQKIKLLENSQHPESDFYKL